LTIAAVRLDHPPMDGSSAWRPTSPTASLLLVVMLGCTNDYDGPNASTAAGSSSASSASSGGAGGATASASSTGGQGGAVGGSAGAASSTAAGPGGSGGVGGVTGGAGGQPPVLNIECADDVVCTGEQVCCIADQLPSGFDVSCTLPPRCPSVQAMCDGSEDCDGGQICCGTFLPNGDYTHIECQPTCGDGMELEMCHGPDEACVTGNRCLPSDTLGPPWGYCD
jgi:hypothetical protein